jgi:hypothetical protein
VYYIKTGYFVQVYFHFTMSLSAAVQYAAPAQMAQGFPAPRGARTWPMLGRINNWETARIRRLTLNPRRGAQSITSNARECPPRQKLAALGVRAIQIGLNALIQRCTAWPSPAIAPYSRTWRPTHCMRSSPRRFSPHRRPIWSSRSRSTACELPRCIPSIWRAHHS